MTRIFRFLIKIYSYAVSPLLGRNCRYCPTCSQYADEALKRHGVLKGLYLSLMRVLRCHPWSRRSFDDQVPKQFAWRDVLGYKRSIRKLENEPEKENK